MPAVRSFSADVVGTGTSVTGTLPAGTVAGDVLYALYTTANGGNPARPAGWTLIDSGTAGTQYQWVLAAAPYATGLSLAFTHTGSIYRELLLLCVSGGNTSTLRGAFSRTTPTTGANTINPPSITPQDGGSLALAGGVHWGGSAVGGFGAPAGYAIKNTNTATDDSVLIAKTGAISSPEDPANITNANSSTDNWFGFTLEVLPPASGGVRNRILEMLNQGGLLRAQAFQLLHPPVVAAAAAAPLNLDASGGTATADGGTVGLSITLASAGGGATAGGGTVAFSDGLIAAAGAATGAGGTVGLAVGYTAAGGGATAGGGTVSLSVGLSAAGGAATAGGGSDSLTFVYGASGGSATAGGGDASASITTDANVSASGGTATAGGGTVSLSVTLAASGGGASAAGGSVSLSVDTPPPPVVETPASGPTGGADFGDESSITGQSVTVRSGRGYGEGWGLPSRVTVVSAERKLWSRLILPSFERRTLSEEFMSRAGAGEGWGAPATFASSSTVVSSAGAGVGHGGEGRALTMDGSPEAEDLMVMALLDLL